MYATYQHHNQQQQQMLQIIQVVPRWQGLPKKPEMKVTVHSNMITGLVCFDNI
jgi:hypothetical protein